MRVVDLSVPALGFKAHDKQVFKVLATYDGLCNCTKIYVNDKLRGEFLFILVRAIREPDVVFCVQASPILSTSGSTCSNPSRTSPVTSARASRWAPVNTRISRCLPRPCTHPPPPSSLAPAGSVPTT